MAARVRWLIAIVLSSTGCPGSEAVAVPDGGTSNDAVAPDDLPPSNCPRGPAPPVTWCRERREGYSVGSAAQFSEGSRFVTDWVNVTSGSSGRVESIFGERGIVIESVATGSFAHRMSVTCSDEGRVAVQRGTTGNRRTRYDTADRVLSYEYDENADDMFESRWFQFYDERGDLTRQEHDTGIDTPIDRIHAYTYDDRQRMVTATMDRDADGVIEMTWYHVWDELDREIEQTAVDDNGEPIERWRWTYDGPRLLQTEITGLDPYRWTYRYDERDRWVVLEFFDTQANVLDARATQTYDEQDRPLEYSQDDGFNESIDYRVWWEYCEVSDP